MNYRKISEEEFEKLLNSIADNELKENAYLNHEDKLDLSGLRLEDQDIEKIIEELKNNNDISSLDFSDNNIGNKGAKAISELLKIKFITDLSLDYNKIQDQGAKSIAESLNYNKSLICLKLEHNEISDEGIKALLSSIQKNCLPLTKISVLYNNFSNKCIMDVSESPGGEIIEMGFSI